MDDDCAGLPVFSESDFLEQPDTRVSVDKSKTPVVRFKIEFIDVHDVMLRETLPGQHTHIHRH